MNSNSLKVFAIFRRRILFSFLPRKADKSPVKMSSTKDAILASMGGDFFGLDFKA